MISRNAQRQQAVKRGGAAGVLRRVEQQTQRSAQTARAVAYIAAARVLRSRRGVRGLSLVELLISLAITAMLMTATMVAIDASFKAYAAAAESASAQTATRMVINRVLTLVRTSTAHGPLALSEGTADWPVAFVSGSSDTLESRHIELIEQAGARIRIEFRPGEDGEPGWLYILRAPDASSSFTNAEPLLGGVENARFYTHRRHDADGVLVLERGSIDVTVVPDQDNTLSIESDTRAPIRVIASTMPRKLD